MQKVNNNRHGAQQESLSGTANPPKPDCRTAAGLRLQDETTRREQTTYISGQWAARFCRALTLAFTLSLAICLAAEGNESAAADAAGMSNSDIVSVFGATQTKVKNSKSFHSWDTLLKRYAKQLRRLAMGRGRMNEKAGSKLWNELIDSLRGQEPVTQVNKVNSYFNSLIPYSPDRSQIW